MKDFEQLLEVVRRKAKYDQSNSWYLGPHTYLNELKKKSTKCSMRSRESVRVT